MHALWALMVAFLWGGGSVIKKHYLNFMSAEALMAAVGIINGVLLMGYVLWGNPTVASHLWARMTTQNITALGTLTILSVLIPNLLFYRVLKNNSAHIVVALSYTVPAFVVLLGIAFLKERPTAGAAAGVLLVTLGTILIALSSEQ